MIPKWRNPRHTVITSDAYATDAVAAAANVAAAVRSIVIASASSRGRPARSSSRKRAVTRIATLMPLPITIDDRNADAAFR